MKMILLFVVLMAFMIGCGGGSSDSGGGDDDASSSAQTSSSSPTSDYDYNTDSGVTLPLNASVINTRKEVKAHLETLKDDKEAFDAYLKIFETTLLSSSFETFSGAPLKRNVELDIPSNAPLGDAKSMIVTVKDGKIDYSSYQLKGDVNEDSIVDFTDIELLNDAIFNDYYNTDYDVNSDGNVDLEDIIDVSARLLTEIGYFDFYTTDGEKLDIATRSAQAEKIFSYSGSATQVMLVAKDTNMVSSFATGLSDLDEVWYKQEYVIEDVTVDYNSNLKESVSTRALAPETCTYVAGPRVPPKVSSIKHSLLQQAIAFAIDAQPEEHLTSWNFSVRYGYRGNYSDQDSGLLNTDFTMAKATVDKHFEKADMGNAPAIQLSTEKEFIYKAGRSMGITTKVSADHSIHNDEICTKNGKLIRLKYIILASSVLSISDPIYALEGIIEGEPFKGKLFLHRIGPTPSSSDFEAIVDGAKFSAPFLPYGEFTVKAETECGCEIQLSDAFIFTDTTTSVTVSNPDDATKELYLSLDVKDKEQKKIEGAEVKIVSEECATEAFSDSATTDSNGNVRFENLKPASYKVFVNGKLAKTILVCGNTNTVVNIVENPLWKLHVDLVTTVPDIEDGSITIRNFSIDLKKSTWTTFVAHNYMEEINNIVSVNYSAGVKHNDGLSVLDINIGTNTIEWSALMYVKEYNQAGLDPWQSIGSMDYGGYTTSDIFDCNGRLPSGFQSKVEEGISFDWNSPATAEGGARCHFILEPCKNSECSDEE